MTLAFPFLRRSITTSLLPTNTYPIAGSLVHEYLFLPTIDLGSSGKGNPIAPTLPGNDATAFEGPNSNNFIFDIGTRSASKNWSGTHQPIPDPTKLPDPSTMTTTFFPSPQFTSVLDNTPKSLIRDIHWAPRTSGVNLTGIPDYVSYFDTGQGGFSAENYRDALYDFWWDQGARGVGDVCMGWPNWNLATNRKTNYIVNSGGASIPYRIFRININNIDTAETGGQVSQFDYRISLKVGNVL